ncbi:hypothetical protein O6H91_02G012000 [Diphasiastrum complanatum]|uniref:Uncharacterized protein n=1 Tax=Diphasiastrum complanatum TaxID=34168 RepID=A0ACC2ECV2_DIPCM|nr:hypothetical protein O6H91_02G012000 [Diphasiastrum complanatum]
MGIEGEGTSSVGAAVEGNQYLGGKYDDAKISVDTITAALECGTRKMQDFMWPKDEELEESVADLPVIDLEKLRNAGDEELGQLLKDLAKACQEWGFIRLFNHGLTSDLLRRLEEQMWRLFSLPIEVKRNAPCPPKREIGFFSGADEHIFVKLIWHEGLQLFCDPKCVDEHAEKFWPCGGGEEFKSVIKEYMRASQHLGLELLHYLTTALNLDSSKFKTHCEGTNSCLRLNYYPICERPADALGLNAHADDDALTILFEDQVGGLQVLKDNKWFSIQPQPDSLVVNVGDILEVWSNSIYPSVVHRVAVNSEKRRVSAALFLYPEPESVIEPATELIDADHPAKFKQFSFEEYRISFYDGELIDKAKARFKLIELKG